MTIITKLGKYVGEYGLIPKTGSGLKAPDLKNLEKLNIIEMGKIPLKSGKAPANPNAFRLTDLGRRLAKMSLSQAVSVAESVLRAKKSLDETKGELDSIKQSISRVEEEIAGIERMLERVSVSQQPVSRTSPSSDLSEERILSILRQVEMGAGPRERSGYLYSTDLYYVALGRLGLGEKEINDILYSLYDRNLLELQMGDSSGGNRGVRTLSGKLFHWGKVKGGA